MTTETTETQSLSNGQRAIGRALEEWDSLVMEPRGTVSEHRILDYIREGAGWTWVKTYKNRKFAWCGCFAAWCWQDSVSLAVRKKAFPSTYRLRRWGRGTARAIALEDARAGDLIIVGDRKSWGDHIALFDAWDGDAKLLTVEGNAVGRFPNNKRGEGVIRRSRDADEVRYVWRPLDEDR